MQVYYIELLFYAKKNSLRAKVKHYEGPHSDTVCNAVSLFSIALKVFLEYYVGVLLKVNVASSIIIHYNWVFAPQK
jgi:hypothetical protein